MRPNEVVHRFIASIGRPKAVEQYLQLFHAEQKQRFACVFIHSEVLRDNHNALVANLLFLQKLDLTPVLVLDDSSLHQELVARLPAGFPQKLATPASAADVTSEGYLPIILAAHAAQRTQAATELASRKVVYLINQSGLQPEGEAVRSLVNMRTDVAALMQAHVLPGPQQELLGEIRGLFAASNHAFSVSVTSAQDLLRELFTVRGAGTLLRRGTEVQRLSGYDQLDRNAFAALLGSAFGHAPTAQLYDRELVGLYLAADYQGVAVLEAGPLVPYLSKFAVDLRAQGEGIGGDLWRALCDDHPAFFWRSRPDNPIAAWYAANCDGLFRCPDWTVYWRGLPATAIAEAVQLASAAPVDFNNLSHA